MSPQKRAQWSSDSLKAAVAAIQGGMKIKRAAINFNIPRSTLQRHAWSGNTVKRLGRKSFLTDAQETELCSRIFRLAEIGMPLTSKILRRSVYTFCSENNVPFPPTKHNSSMVGRKWLKLFLRRHPEVARRKSQNVNPARAAKLNRFIVEDYFKTLRTVMAELDVMDKPQLIFNMDEKGCQLTIHKEPVILTRKGIKRVPFVAPEHAENVTVVSCGNAIGQIIPPVVLFKGQRNKPEFSDNLPPGCKAFMTAKGSMTCDTFVKWIAHFAQYKPPGKVLLIFDGAKSHLDANIVEAADTHEITLLCLPSNCTHELQPMDKSVFRSFEYHWDDELQRYWSLNPGRKLTKSSFGNVFSKVWPKATTPSNVSAGFRATGIYPFDPTIIPETAFAPSTLSERPLENQNNANSPATTIPSSPNPVQQTMASELTRKQEVDGPSTSTPRVSTNNPRQKQKRLRRVSDDDSSDDENEWQPSESSTSETSESSDEELEANKSRSFTEILKTPELPAKSKAPPKKAINYRAVKVVKLLFAEKKLSQKEPSIAKKRAPQSKQQTANLDRATCSGVATPRKESWYCPLCKEDKQKDMRQCTVCQTWVHEECCGLMAKDVIPFFRCPSCEESE